MFDVICDRFKVAPKKTINNSTVNMFMKCVCNSQEHSECKGTKNAYGNSLYSGMDYTLKILLFHFKEEWNCWRYFNKSLIPVS
jgi:hypothetical protein